MSMSIKKFIVTVTSLIGLAVTSALGVILLNGFKNNSNSTNESNATIDYFIAAITIIGSFMGLASLVVVGKFVIDTIKE